MKKILIFTFLLIIPISLTPNAYAMFLPPIEIIDSTGDGGGNVLTNVYDIAVDSSGSVFVSGQGSDNVFKITPGGVITEIINSTGDGDGNTLSNPSGVAVDSSGNVFVSGQGSDNVFKITPEGIITEIIDSTGDGGGNTLAESDGVAVDSSGFVFVAGYGSDNVFKITPGGVITAIINSTGDGGWNTLSNPSGVAVDPSGNVFVSAQGSHNAFKITPGGVITKISDSIGGGGNPIIARDGIAVDSLGNVFLVGSTNNVFKITPDGIITEIIDSTGDGLGNTVNCPRDIAVDSSGNVFVSTFCMSNAFKINTPGTCSTSGTPCTITEIIDTYGDGSGNILSESSGIDIDSSGFVFVGGFGFDNAFKIDFACSVPVSGDLTVTSDCPLFRTAGDPPKSNENSDMSCIVPENEDEIKEEYENLLNSLISDWELTDVHVGCFGIIQTVYQLPEFSSETTMYSVMLSSDYNLRSETLDIKDFLTKRNQVVSNSISKLLSNEVFKEVDAKFVNKSISFSYGTGIFGITAYNESENKKSSFEIDTTRDDLVDFELTNNLDMKSLPIIQKVRQHGGDFLKNSRSHCEIKICSESSCGKTDVYTSYTIDNRGIIPYAYTARIDMEGLSCPPFIKVGLTPNMELSYVFPFDEKGVRTGLPQYVEKEITPEILQDMLDNMDTGQITFKPPLKQMKKAIKPETVVCNEGLELIFKSSDGSPACVKQSTSQKLLVRGWTILGNP